MILLSIGPLGKKMMGTLRKIGQMCDLSHSFFRMHFACCNNINRRFEIYVSGDRFVFARRGRRIIKVARREEEKKRARFWVFSPIFGVGGRDGRDKKLGREMLFGGLGEREEE